MGVLVDAGYAATALLLVAAFVLAVLQTVRLCREASGGQAAVGALLLDGVLLLHLVVLCLVMRSAEDQALLLALPAGVVVPVGALLWVNALGLGLAVFCALRYRDARELLVAVVLAATLPPVLPWAGDAAAAVCGVDCAVLAVRIAWPYLLGSAWSGQGIRSASPAEVLNLLPHGVLCAHAGGRIVLLNDQMRQVLTALGLKTDLGDARDVFAALCGGSRAEPLTATLADGRVFLIAVDDEYLDPSGLRFAFAYDISSETQVNRQLAQANRQLEQQNRELSHLLQSILRAADNEANLQMRGRVHDIVGQRLSILHRSLEDDRIDDAAIAQMQPLLDDLLDDLRPGAETEPAAELAAVVDAFGLAGVDCSVTGVLATEPDAARLQVRVVREALTNALRHGHARQVRIFLGRTDGRQPGQVRWSVQVENDGDPVYGRIREGNGLTGLRRAVEARGGRFAVDGEPHFTVRAELPGTSQDGGDAT